MSALRGVLAALGLALPLAGCSLLGLGTNRPSVELYSLTADHDFRADLPAVGWQLVVSEPLATGGLDTNRIAVRHDPLELEFYATGRWAVRAPKMVQTLLIESLEGSGRILAVGRETVGLRSDYALQLELRRFQAEAFDAAGRPNVRVQLAAKLLRQPRQRIIASETFEWMVQAKSRNLRDVVGAFDEALRQVLHRTVEWTIVTPAAVAAEEANRAPF